MDNIFVLFTSTGFVNWFREYISSKHQNINSKLEREEINLVLFFEVKICRKNDRFITSVYKKPTFSGVRGVLTNYESFIPAYQKEDFLTNCYSGVSTYAVILKPFIWRFGDLETSGDSFDHLKHSPKKIIIL